MRRFGAARPALSPGSRRHASCLHGYVAEYRRCLAEFSAEGLEDGLRVAYVCSDGAEAAREDLADLSGRDRLLAAGALHVLSARDAYGTGGPVDPERVVAFFAAATEQALADGFGGLAVSADATKLVGTPAALDAFARYEFLVDRYMAGHPLWALCGYGLELGNDTVTEFALLHAPGPPNEAPARMFGCADGAIGLAGQFDPGGVAALGRVLPRLRTADGVTLVVDMADVEYLDHRLLLMLDGYARRSGVAVSLRSAPPFAARLMELLPVSSLQRTEPGVQGSGAQR
ncbi:MEDS domain-containing protein [Pseudonocardia acidicola]|uniref:MEDS domain-containing protein n=1 Tax=Pseudonocardia acidicola TaxID=2724939 RepID=UPI0023B2D358|nr:MEDS domain-containing protein [Pseudonocardia acidicola]